MTYRESAFKAAEIAAQALTQMDSLDIPPYPDNYELWYAYSAGADAELSRQLDTLTEPGESFDPASYSSIKQSYLGAEARNLLKIASDDAESIILDIARSIASASDNVRNYGDKLADFQDHIDEAEQEKIQLAVAKIIADTKEVMARNTQLEDELQSASERIESLSTSLDEARRASQTDGLTGLPNRRAFDLGLDAEIERARAEGSSLALVFADIDHFKNFNDLFGHRVGDEVLKLVGRVFQALLKGRDLPARYGGEEFAALLPVTDQGGAFAVCEQIRKAIAGKSLRSARTGQTYGNVTMSFGCATLWPDDTAATLMERADAGLYRAKQTGRNRTCCETDLESVVESA